MSISSTLHKTVVRPALPADGPAVLALLKASGLPADFVPTESVVATCDGASIGCARLRPLPGGHELASAVVAEGHRHEGLGTRLVEAALAPAKGPVYALALAPAFFAQLGFERLPETPPDLRDRAGRDCAKTPYVPMRWTARPSRPNP